MLTWKRHLVIELALLVTMPSLCACGTSCPQASGLTFQAALLCYWELDTELSAMDAHTRCQNEGGQLALIPSADAEDFILSNFPLDSYPFNDCSLNECTHYWVGYRDDVTRGTFTTWGGQSAPWVSPTLSDHSDGSYQCVRIKRSGDSLRWMNRPCDSLRRGICSASIDSPSPSPLTQASWKGEPGRLPCDVISSMTSPSPMQCAGQCQQTSGCTTFNFHRQTGNCELCPESSSAVDSAAAGFRHYERK